MEVAVEAAQASGTLLRDRLGTIREIRHKGAVDLVTDVDVQSEKLLRETILAAFPSHSILGEEGGSVAGPDPRFRWIVDPLDGTTNYAHGFPFFCVSVGFEAEGQLAAGVVYDPLLDELFVAQQGAGAAVNGKPLRVTEETVLSSSLLATGFPYDRARFPRALKAFGEMGMASRAVRRAGSAALDLCYVAAGRLDGYWEYDVRPWDLAAGALMVTEAGGTVTRVDGSPFYVESGEVLSSNGRIHTAMLAVLGTIDRT